MNKESQKKKKYKAFCENLCFKNISERHIIFAFKSTKNFHVGARKTESRYTVPRDHG